MDINSKVFDAPREQILEALGLLSMWVMGVLTSVS